MVRIKLREPIKGEYVGRTTELGTVTYYFTSENLYEVTCNCGVSFMVKVAAAKLGSLGCKDCIRAMQASYGKKGNAMQASNKEKDDECL